MVHIHAKKYLIRCICITCGIAWWNSEVQNVFPDDKVFLSWHQIEIIIYSVELEATDKLSVICFISRLHALGLFQGPHNDPVFNYLKGWKYTGGMIFVDLQRIWPCVPWMCMLGIFAVYKKKIIDTHEGYDTSMNDGDVYIYEYN